MLIRISITKSTQGGTLEVVGTVNVLCVGVSMRGIDRPTLPPISIRAPPRVIPWDYSFVRASAISVWPQPTAGGTNGQKNAAVAGALGKLTTPGARRTAAWVCALHPRGPWPGRPTRDLWSRAGEVGL